MTGRVDVDGVSIAYDRRGDGPPVVLLHGLPGDHRLWQRQVADLSDEFTVVAWDAPGCGTSAAPDRPFGLTDVAGLLAGFIDALGLDRPHVVGLSWGAGVALELARISPDAAASLVLASGYAGWAGSLAPEVVAQRLDAYLTASRSPETVRSWGSGMFSPTASSQLIAEGVALVTDFDGEVLATLARSFADADLRPALPTITVPTLVLHGDQDARSPLNVGIALHEAIPRAELVVLPGVGHVSNVEAPELFNRELRRFLRSIGPAATNAVGPR